MEPCWKHDFIHPSPGIGSLPTLAHVHWVPVQFGQYNLTPHKVVPLMFSPNLQLELNFSVTVDLTENEVNLFVF